MFSQLARIFKSITFTDNQQAKPSSESIGDSFANPFAKDEETFFETDQLNGTDLSKRQRKRRTKDHNVYIEGKTREHASDEEQCVPLKKTGKVKDTVDSFMLVSCCDFVESVQGCPYQVVLESTAAVVMDIHAHLCKTEVIGLLGGLFDKQTGCLRVVRAEPCVSHSTSIHCDMDPVSQTKAGQLIQDSGLNVVGWYHSHPTFVPDPSNQDIESQEAFQKWFSKGGDHFLGIIISPYNITNTTVNSEIRCFTTADRTNKNGKLHASSRSPFKFDYKIDTSADNKEIIELVQRVSRLLDMHKNYEHRVDLLDTYRSTSELTSLDKMLLSVKSYLLTANEKLVSVSMIMDDLRYVITNFCEKND